MPERNFFKLHYMQIHKVAIISSLSSCELCVQLVGKNPTVLYGSLLFPQV